jgi:hypothetical protein
MGIISNVISFGAGYALGARKGYEPIRSASRRAGSAIGSKIPMLSSSTRRDQVLDVREVRDVMTGAPETIESSAKLHCRRGDDRKPALTCGSTARRAGFEPAT